MPYPLFFQPFFGKQCLVAFRFQNGVFTLVFSYSGAPHFSRTVLSETANITSLLILSAFFCFSHLGDMHAQSTMFRHCILMFSIVIGQRPDGSRVLLNRPHGTAQRVGSPLFRALFLSFGGSNRIRTVIYTFAEPVDWFQLRVSHSRIYLFFTYRPPTVVPSPRVAVVARPASPAVTDPDSSVASDV